MVDNIVVVDNFVDDMLEIDVEPNNLVDSYIVVEDNDLESVDLGQFDDSFVVDEE